MTLAAVVSRNSQESERGSDKRAGAFRTISEVAGELDVPQHVLRFWESRFAQIKPVKRAGGRRYYRPEDVDLLRGIRRLLHGQGYTIKGAQRVLREHGVRFVHQVGRGEAEAGLPAPSDREPDNAAGACDPTAGSEAAGAEAVHAAFDIQALGQALDELIACRAALSALAAGDDEEA